MGRISRKHWERPWGTVIEPGSNPGSGTSEAPSFRGFLRSGGRAPHPGGDLLPVETALGRAVAVAIVRLRAEHDLSQRELAEHLGMKQPQVARLELGEVNSSMETLMRVSAELGIEFTIDVRPAGTPVQNVTKRAQANSLVGSLRKHTSA